MTNMTPFKALPTELLIEIFSLVPGTDDPLVAITLASVSARWREVVLSSPTIWQSIFLDNSRPISASTFQILLWLRHSNPLQFDVHLTTSDSTSILPLLSPLLDPERRMRWRYFSLRGPGTREEHFDLSGYSAAPFDILRFCIQDTSNVDWSPSYMRTFTPGNESCGHFAMNIWAPELWVPSPSVILPFPAITIAEVTIPTQPHLLLQFLSACPYLDAFSLAGRLHHDNRPTLPLPVIRLPHLRTLRLVSTCITRSFLSSIDAPSLNALYLGQLNVDFELNNRPAEPEDGDSDDEAQDFSPFPFKRPCNWGRPSAPVAEIQPAIENAHYGLERYAHERLRLRFLSPAAPRRLLHRGI
ncbi:hypothetical protein MIND_00857100 [Mycena indigotica]|uniref:F-box domain-containing protein n=1 Tax=Mycena indigotica TaxID=2126181 RepID=A0A8H6W2B6_9AGAR|nr:uncharacterized protein MIND_00857100 [Mycena indigotica]KAF7299088.1 hypothetical protein MIND_00857100 [Mycena indigotica]